VRIACYTSSSDVVERHYRDAAVTFGTLLARRGDELVYGGTAVGLMGALAAAVRSSGGRVTGVLPLLMRERGLADEACDELIVTDGMAARKQTMIERAEAFVALPGGFGTLEELFEVLTLKQLGYHDRAIVLLDVEGFFDPLLALFDHLFDGGFAKRAYEELYHVARTPEEAFAHLDAYDPGELPTKWY
jgi:cytokinin riboside 5'-monophosphate phosphoribohydrolase